MRAFFILERIRIDKKISCYELRRELNRIAVENAIISLRKEVDYLQSKYLNAFTKVLYYLIFEFIEIQKILILVK